MNTRLICQTSNACRILLALCLCTIVFALAGCGAIHELTSSPEPVRTTQPKPEVNLREQAAKAWEQKNYGQSEKLYARLLQQPDLTKQERLQGWERFMESAIQNKHYQRALQSLPIWEKLLPEGQQSVLWQDATLRTLQGVVNTDQGRQQLSELYQNQNRPARLRAGAGAILAALSLKQGDMQNAYTMLMDVRNIALGEGREAQAVIERSFFLNLAELPESNIQSLLSYLPPNEHNHFPATILRLELARRLYATPAGKAQGARMVQELSPFLADKELISEVLGIEKPSGDAKGIALVLPITGPYGRVGSKVVRGAGYAQAELAQQGISLDIQIINSDSADWENTLRGLPEGIRIVGGPLQVDVFKRMQSSGLIRSKPVFTFLSSLGDAREGQDAWRFFSSPTDQIHTLLDAATDSFSATNVGILAPDDQYGLKMAQLFEQSAVSRGMAISTRINYPPKESLHWGDRVGDVVKSGCNAVFMPGDWSDAEMLVPYLMYHGAENMLVMGTTIWGQTLAKKKYAEMPSFHKTIFPGVWWEHNSTPATTALMQRVRAARQPEPDFWVALGYDFVRMAANLGDIPADWQPQLINQKLQSAQNISWSMAPLSWDATGQATQHLFVFKPTQTGYTLLQDVGPTPVPESQPAAPGSAPDAVQQGEEIPSDMPDVPYPANQQQQQQPQKQPEQNYIIRSYQQLPDQNTQETTPAE